MTGWGDPCLNDRERIGNGIMPSEEDIVERLRRRAARARDRYPDEADDPATLVGGLIQDYEAAAAGDSAHARRAEGPVPPGPACHAWLKDDVFPAVYR